MNSRNGFAIGQGQSNISALLSKKKKNSLDFEQWKRKYNETDSEEGCPK